MHQQWKVEKYVTWGIISIIGCGTFCEFCEDCEVAGNCLLRSNDFLVDFHRLSV